MSNKKYYWLKLKRDFFKRHDIRIIESMPNGKDYILFYLKLLCESIDHLGNLRFSEQIPYNEEMLATITNTNVDIVRSAVKIFTQLGMMDILDDGTFYMSEVERMIGGESEWAEKKRIYRENHQRGQIEDKSRTMSIESWTMSGPCPLDVRQEIDIDKEKELDKEKETSISSTEGVREKPKKTISFLVSLFSDEFEEVWKMYPKKQGKSEALKAYAKARNEGTSQEEIMESLKKYVAYTQGRETKYIKNGSTWFNQKCWEDKYEDETGMSTHGFDYAKLEELANRKSLGL